MDSHQNSINWNILHQDPLELAQKTADLINDNGLGCEIDGHKGDSDHGAWVPAVLMFPDLEVPIFQLSIQQHMDA